MANLLRRLWWEERASVPVTGWLLVATVLMLGSAAGLAAVQKTLMQHGLVPPPAHSSDAR